MLKKLNLILLCVLLVGCSLGARSGRQNWWGRSFSDANSPTAVESTDYSRVDLGNADSLRVAMLLPLSGKAAAVGQEMKNAAMMAVGNLNNNNLVVQFYDTKSTGSGARVAFENALNADSNLILGPLMADEVAAIGSEAKRKDIPVISFSTSPTVLQEGVYTIGLLNDAQIKRIVRYAAGHGRRRLAVVLPNNQSGENMFKSVMRAGRLYDVEIVKVGFYAPDTMDFTGLVTSMVGSAKVAAATSKSATKSADVGVDFDALLVPESGNRLKSITSMFSYYDVAAPEVLFLGTSVWSNTGLSKETELYGAVYPVMPLGRWESFAEQYKELFGARPNALSIFAYDAVTMASDLSRKDVDDLEDEITRPEGYSGMSGAFRIFADGQNEHGLDVVRVTAGGPQLVEAAPQQFYGLPLPSDYDSGVVTYTLPMVYGKSAAELQNVFNNGR